MDQRQRRREDGATRLTVQRVQFNVVQSLLSWSKELLSHEKSTGRHAEVTLALRYTLGPQPEAIIAGVQSMLVARGFFFYGAQRDATKNVFFLLINALFFYSCTRKEFV